MAARVSIYRIAEFAGVSPSTVSRALNNDPKVADWTRTRIHEIAKGLQAEAESDLARHTAIQPKQCLRLAFYNESWLDVWRLQEGVQAALENTGHELFCISNQSGEYPCEQLFARRLDGLICLGAPPVLLSKYPDLQGVAAVQVMGSSPDHEAFRLHVTYNAYDVGKLMVGYLAGCCAPIFYFNNVANQNVAAAKYRESLVALHAGMKGLEFKSFQYSEQQFGRDLEEILSQLRASSGGKMLALACYNDMVARDIRVALERLALRQGVDYRLIGCDNSLVLADYVPRPASIDIQLEAIGREAVNGLLRLIQTPTVTEAYTLLLPPKLIVPAE